MIKTSGKKLITLKYFPSMNKQSKKTNEGPSIGPIGPKGKEGPPGINNSFGPSSYVRDENGLLKNVQYEFNNDGSVNWRAMIKEEHLFPNKSWFEMYKKPTPKTIEGLKDNQLLIKLSGIKELARLRGFDSVSYETVKCEHDHVAVKCTVCFMPNYETVDRVVYEDMANATFNNTSSFATKFLETIACNRAFVRAVRNFLNVHIVGDDEIDKSDNKNLEIKSAQTSSSFSSPNSLLQSFMEKDSGVNSFDGFKDKLRELWAKEKYRNEDAKNWSCFEDIPPKEARILLGIFKK
ncbi:MAG: hypothetical protein EBY39_10260 [Flavobacteriia bacterium]|nr:hypothetical protein [Flavobacteriia bacterium]